MTSMAELAKRAEKFTIDNSPLILTAAGALGAVSTMVLAYRGGYKAGARVLSEELVHNKDGFFDEDHEYIGLTAKEKLALTWPTIIPATLACGVTVASIVASNRIGTRRAAAIAAAYTITEKAFEEYKDKVKEKFGEAKEQGVRDAVNQDQVSRSDDSKVVIMTGSDQLCYDTFSGHYFNGNVEDIKWAVNKLNNQINHHGYASLSELYDEIGIPVSAMSEEMGWNDQNLIDIQFGATVAPSGKAAIALNYRVQPIRNYFRVH